MTVMPHNACGALTTPRAITYCTNIHPGESWADVMYNLNTHVPAVKQAVSRGGPFPLGLRVSHRAASEVTDNDLRAFRRWCVEHDCYLLTINGFPYGAFHGRRVKQDVYQPDWLCNERVAYTKRLADLAIAMATRPLDISISTVPIAFKTKLDAIDWLTIHDNLYDVLVHLERIHQNTGNKVRLALEPEPACILETIDEVLAFFEQMAFPERLREYIGICFDACHQAVEFEEPVRCLDKLAEAQIPIVKVQVSSALRARGDEIASLKSFDEPVYLHQTVAKDASPDKTALHHFSDLGEFIDRYESGFRPQECRVHFHVPIFADHLGVCGTTQFFLKDLLPRLPANVPLEIETYSFGVLPSHLQQASTEACIIRELQWLHEYLELPLPAEVRHA